MQCLYQLDPFDCVKRRAALFVEDSELCEHVASLYVFYRIYLGECCSEELFHLIPAAEFQLRITRHNGPPQYGFQGTLFHVLQSCGMNFLVACNAPVIPLVLQEYVGGGVNK
ncbi:unnamed protein product [Leptidea sinapis]|uniref:Uncharacterized protein n=1 Tax=Leptidea sinapis TaxID=189913 RepID=A0A5E4QTQ6_9NEOP|nr:unnamed protein product [Leptidea sinapis]